MSWTSEPDFTRTDRYDKRSGTKREVRPGRAAIRSPMKIRRDESAFLERVVNDIEQEENERGRFIRRWHETSNPFLDGGPVRMYAIKPDKRDEFERRLDELGYDWVFIPRAQFRFHPQGTVGHYVILPDNWRGDWPDT